MRKRVLSEPPVLAVRLDRPVPGELQGVALAVQLARGALEEVVVRPDNREGLAVPQVQEVQLGNLAGWEELGVLARVATPVWVVIPVQGVTPVQGATLARVATPVQGATLAREGMRVLAVQGVTLAQADPPVQGGLRHAGTAL
ncbi:MAG: hypothetical protein NZX77_02380 [Polyangiaceae bacterium]|nr:hypothetical protein [Polyangiaceae bacterium]